ncbi:hypothetical protein [Streptomyces sp. GQFP]|uniref:hypothetical protein n=1 Tax=Streptomyces sp. GQFP TaxID=2907545 RepID=UPI001F35FD84|nr:hypothetical protein [Streptomyces sp. GQFP]UIX29921.1 hypothetical protein LUX31_07660 [Streptomyces sp. GQFP]
MRAVLALAPAALTIAASSFLGGHIVPPVVVLLPPVSTNTQWRGRNSRMLFLPRHDGTDFRWPARWA